MQWDHLTTLRQLHRREGAAACCCSGARGSSAFVVGGLELVDAAPFAASADEGGDNERGIEADPKEKNCAENPVSMRRRDSWRCILIERDIL